MCLSMQQLGRTEATFYIITKRLTLLNQFDIKTNASHFTGMYDSLQGCTILYRDVRCWLLEVR
jgi:hypothetical protein